MLFCFRVKSKALCKNAMLCSLTLYLRIEIRVQIRTHGKKVCQKYYAVEKRIMKNTWDASYKTDVSCLFDIPYSHFYFQAFKCCIEMKFGIKFFKFLFIFDLFQNIYIFKWKPKVSLIWIINLTYFVVHFYLKMLFSDLFSLPAFCRPFDQYFCHKFSTHKINRINHLFAYKIKIILCALHKLIYYTTISTYINSCWHSWNCV